LLDVAIVEFKMRIPWQLVPTTWLSVEWKKQPPLQKMLQNWLLKLLSLAGDWGKIAVKVMKNLVKSLNLCM
jgi:hypothetical protein